MFGVGGISLEVVEVDVVFCGVVELTSETGELVAGVSNVVGVEDAASTIVSFFEGVDEAFEMGAEGRGVVLEAVAKSSFVTVETLIILAEEVACSVGIGTLGCARAAYC